jgi:uncharacterized protein YjbJ (UPF0337 family)
MVSVAEKASGLANEVIGKAKQGIGSAVGSDKLKEEGIAQELKGHAQQAIGDVKAVVETGAAAGDRESEVRERAYRIWQGEGSPHGRDHDHWYRAEREVDEEEAG